VTTATITSKGQITVPANVRQALSLKAGDRIEFVQVEPGQFPIVAANRSVTDLKEMFGKATRTVSIDEMNRAVAARGSVLHGSVRVGRRRSP
jgi:antitoxin PrlF